MFDKIFKILCLVIAFLFLVVLSEIGESTAQKHKATLEAYNDCRVRGSSEEVCSTLLGK